MEDTQGRSIGSLRRYELPAPWLCLAGSAALMALLYYAWFPPTYSATSQLKVEFDNSACRFAEAQQIDVSQSMQSQAALIANPIIIGAALAKHPELSRTPMLKNSENRATTIRRALRIQVVPRTQFIQVQMSSPVPVEASKLVNAVVEAYLKHAQTIDDTSTQKRIDLLKVTRDEQRATLLKQRALVQTLAERIGAESPAAVAKQVEIEYARKDLQRAEAVFDRIEDTLNQYQWSIRNPSMRVELNYLAQPSVRPGPGLLWPWRGWRSGDS